MVTDITQAEAQGVNAQLRQRAEMNLEACTAELHAIAERARGYQTELLQLSTERVNLQVKRDELMRTLQAALADREQAMLEHDVAMNTPAEAEAQTRVESIDSLIASVQHDILMIDVEWEIDSGVLRWKQREYNLQEFVKDCFRERDELLKKRSGLSAIHEKAKAAQGKDEQARLVAEFSALDAQEQDVQEQLQALADLRRELQSLISRRLSDWPLLAAETEQAYGPYTPGGFHQALSRWREMALLVEQHAPAISEDEFSAWMRGTIPLGTFKRYGTRAQQIARDGQPQPRDRWDYALSNFDAVMVRIDAHLSQIEAVERKRQAERRAFG